MNELTEKQSEILDYIKSFILDHHYSPSFREIGANFGFSVKAANDHIQALKTKGYITTEENKNRTMRVKENK